MNGLRKLIQETLAELTQNPPVTYLFHGTSDKHLDSIQAHGLKEPYLTSDYTKAGYYATEVSQDVGGEPIVLKVKIPDASRLRVDYNELDEPVMNFDEGETEEEMNKKIQAAYKKYIKENPKSYDKKHDIISVDKKDYWVSLTTTRTVWYDGIIPFESISFDGNSYLQEAHYTTWKKIKPIEEDIAQFQGQEADISQKLAKHFGIGRISPAGSGSQGFAYYIPNNKILKITSDKSEAAEAYKIKGQKLKHLSNIYDVYSLKGKYEGFYVIISEALDRTDDIDDAEHWVAEFFKEQYNEGAMATWLFDDYAQGDVSQEEIKAYLSGIKEFFEPYKAQIVTWYVKGMFGIVDELKKYGIQSTDWVTANLGVKRNGNLAMFDLGYGGQYPPETLQNIHLNEKVITKSQNFSDLTDTELRQIAQWGLEGEFSMSGCWDEAGDDLLKAIECAFNDFKLFIKDPYPQGFNGFPDEPILYRFVTAPNKESINLRKLGQSWFADPNQYKNNTEFFGQLMHLRKRQRPENHKLFLISAKVPTSNIDIRRTLWQRSSNWNENEVVLNNDYDLKIIDIKDMTPELGESINTNNTNHKYKTYKTKDGQAYADVVKFSDYWHIAMIESKKQGGGTAIVKAIIEDAKKAGIKKITLNTTEFSGFGFFDKMGFIEVPSEDDEGLISMEMSLGEDMKHLTANEYPDFFDGQNNPLFHARAYPPKMNIRTGEMMEAEISQEELNKKSLPYKNADMFDDFVIQKTEGEIREIAPDIDLNKDPVLIIKDLEDKYPSLFDNFADWISIKKKEPELTENEKPKSRKQYLIDKIIPELSKKFNYPVKYVTSGTKGWLLQIADDKVMKITGDEIEYENAKKLIASPDNKHFVQYYSAEPISDETLSGNNPRIQFYALIMEKLDMLTDREFDIVDNIMNTLGTFERMRDHKRVQAYFHEMRNQPEVLEYLETDMNEIKKFVSDLQAIYNAGLKLRIPIDDLRSPNLGRNKSKDLVHFDIGMG